MNLRNALHFKCNNLVILMKKKKNRDRGKESYRLSGPGFLVTGNFNIGGRRLRTSEGEDRGNSPEYSLLSPVSLNLSIYLYTVALAESILV